MNAAFTVWAFLGVMRQHAGCSIVITADTDQLKIHHGSSTYYPVMDGGEHTLVGVLDWLLECHQ